MEIKEQKSPERKKEVFTGFIHFFCLYQLLGKIGLDKMGELPKNGWQNCPFTSDEIMEALFFFRIPDCQMEAAINFCLGYRLLEKRGSCYFMTVVGLGQYVRAYLAEQ